MVIIKCNQEELDWSSLVLYAEEIEAAEARDTPEDVRRAKLRLIDEHAGLLDEKQEKRIEAIIGNAKDEMACFRAWHTYLLEHLTFPFEAQVLDFLAAFVPITDVFAVHGIHTVIDVNVGLLGEAEHDGEPFAAPLSDIEIVDHTSPNYQLLDDYVTWYANR